MTLNEANWALMFCFLCLVEFCSGHSVYMEMCSIGVLWPLSSLDKYDAFKVQPCHSVSAVSFYGNTLHASGLSCLCHWVATQVFHPSHCCEWSCWEHSCVYVFSFLWVGPLGRNIIPHWKFWERPSIVNQLSHFAFLSVECRAMFPFFICSPVSTCCISFYFNHSQGVPSVCSLCKIVTLGIANSVSMRSTATENSRGTSPLK